MWCRLIAAWLTLGVLCASCSERREYSYASLADAVAAGETTRGWLPDWLPRSAHAIGITYTLESPRTWCRFEFSPNDVGFLRESFARVDAPPPSVRSIESPGVSWWPAFLSGELDAVGLRNQGFALYVIKEPGVGSETHTVFVVVDAARGRGYFYRLVVE